MTSIAVKNLRHELRSQCGFKDIAALLVDHTVLKAARFDQTKRTDTAHTRFGGHGRERSSWYAATTEADFFPGWTAVLSWEVVREQSWDAQRFLRELQIYGDDDMAVSIKPNGVRAFHQAVVLFAEDFPGMWLADKLRGHLD